MPIISDIMYLQIKEGESYVDNIERIIGIVCGAPPYSSNTIKKIELLNEDSDDGGDSRWMRWNTF